MSCHWMDNQVKSTSGIHLYSSGTTKAASHLGSLSRGSGGGAVPLEISVHFEIGCRLKGTLWNQEPWWPWWDSSSGSLDFGVHCSLYLYGRVLKQCNLNFEIALSCLHNVIVMREELNQFFSIGLFKLSKREMTHCMSAFLYRWFQSCTCHYLFYDKLWPYKQCFQLLFVTTKGTVRCWSASWFTTWNST